MVAWGAKSFENDDALDWLADLCEGKTFEPIRKAFQFVLESEEYLEAPECGYAIAAAEIVAGLRGAAAPDLPDTAGDWLKGRSVPPDDPLIPRARQALDRVRTESELKELWDEASNAGEWYETLDDLEKRLGSE